MTSTHESRRWVPAKVGCYWTRGRYTITTEIHGAWSGYVLYADGADIQHANTFEELEPYAERRVAERRKA